MDFEDGSAVRLTTSRYYTPAGRSIQKPYTNGEGEKYSQDFENRFESGELYEKDKMKINDSLRFKTKKGRIVYGGGGIVPDIFVPLETQKGSENLSYILGSGIVSHFVFEQLDKDRNTFKNLSFEQFMKKQLNDIAYAKKFKQYLSKIGMEVNFDTHDTLVHKYITAELARQLFGEKEYYKIILKDDSMLEKVLK